MNTLLKLLGRLFPTLCTLCGNVWLPRGAGDGVKDSRCPYCGHGR